MTVYKEAVEEFSNSATTFLEHFHFLARLARRISEL
jgi:hypothetical protein